MIMRCFGLAALVLCMASCAKEPGAAPAAQGTSSSDAAVAPRKAAVAVVDPMLIGLWQPYDNVANARLGTLDVQTDRIVFSKGLTLRFEPTTSSLMRVEPRDGATPVSGSDTLCGANPVLSVSFSINETAPRNVLRLSVHDVPTGPGKDPDFDLHRCQTFTYVRD